MQKLQSISVQEFCFGWIRDLKPFHGIAGILGILALDLASGEESLQILLLGTLLAALQFRYRKSLPGENPGILGLLVFPALAILDSIWIFTGVVAMGALLFAFVAGSSLETGIAFASILYFGILGILGLLFLLGLPLITGIGPGWSQRILRVALRNLNLPKWSLALAISYLLCPLAIWFLWQGSVPGISGEFAGILFWAQFLPLLLCLAWGSARIASAGNFKN